MKRFNYRQVHLLPTLQNHSLAHMESLRTPLHLGASKASRIDWMSKLVPQESRTDVPVGDWMDFMNGAF